MSPTSNTTLFFHTTTKAEFGSLFFFIFDHNPHTPIPDAEFANKKVISKVKYGNEYDSVQVDALNLTDKVLAIKYTNTKLVTNMTWIAAVPTIITESVEYQRIQFIENDSLVQILQ